MQAFTCLIQPSLSLFCLHTWLNVPFLSCQSGLSSSPLRNCLPALPTHSPSCISVACHRGSSDCEACFQSLKCTGWAGQPTAAGSVCTAAGVAEITSVSVIIQPWRLTTYLTGWQWRKLISHFLFSPSVAQLWVEWLCSYVRGKWPAYWWSCPQLQIWNATTE